jgi:uncharacterized protein (DUF302 family)
MDLKGGDMRKKLLFGALLTLLGANPVFASEGVVSVPSDFSVGESADRFEAILNNKNMTVFGRIRHSDSAEKVGIDLRPTQLIMFGNPKVGSPLMQCEQLVAIDLPQKALFWEDKKGKVWISYNDPDYLKSRHALSECRETLNKLQSALDGMARAAAKKSDGG